MSVEPVGAGALCAAPAVSSDLRAGTGCAGDLQAVHVSDEPAGHEHLPAVEQALAAFRQELSVQSERLAELSRHCKRLADNMEQEKEGTTREGTEGRTAVAPCGDGSWEGVCGPWWPVWWCPFSGWEPPGTGAGWGHTAADQGTTVPRACTEQAAAPSWQAAAGTWWPPPVDGHAGRQSTALAAPSLVRDADSAASASALGTAHGSRE